MMFEDTLPYDPNEEFSWSHLNRIFETVNEEGYQTLTCFQYIRTGNRSAKENRSAVFRVDVDRSPKKALQMAEMMAQKGITATFFYRLHSPFYNLMDFEALRCFKAVQRLNFEIGLHCEPLDGAYVLQEGEETFMSRDIAVFKAVLGTDFEGCASHRNSSGLNNIDFWTRWKPKDFGLMYEAYDEETFGLFQEGIYVTESLLDRWKVYEKGVLRVGDHRSLQAHILNGSTPLYVLLHPFVFRQRHFFE